jgi:hypothetical protein
MQWESVSEDVDGNASHLTHINPHKPVRLSQGASKTYSINEIEASYIHNTMMWIGVIEFMFP